MDTSPRPLPGLNRRRALAAGAAGLAILSGCGLLPARAAPESPPAVARQGTDAPPEPAAAQEPAGLAEADVIAGIQETLNRQAAARAALDRDAYMATIDQRNLTWRRIQRETFDALAAAGRPRPERYTVTRVQPKQDGYYKAWIDVVAGGGSAVQYQAVWVFRRAETGWLHSEVLVEELGPRQTMETEHFVLSYYAWDDDVIGRMAGVAEQAYARVTERLGAAPGFKAILSVNPTFGAHSGLRGFGTWAAYLPDTKNLILVRSIESYGAGLVSPGETQEDRFLVAITHEYTHLVNDQLVPIVKMPHWMSEGLAQFVSDDFRPDVALRALRSPRFTSLDQASEVIAWGTDPGKGYTQADISMAYAVSAYGVAYFVEQFGLEKFFDLARAFAESRRWDESFTAVTGSDWGQFQRDWLAWTRQRLGA
jgi:hypothetical protein